MGLLTESGIHPLDLRVQVHNYHSCDHLVDRFFKYRHNFLSNVSQLLGLLEKLVIRNAPYKSDAHIFFPS